ncbi:PhzF family phenazine biosynthesis protein [Actinoalloteichus spitiensis]|uniref:PhzF family phenazine biosynthesis protein n=1 Tax=Actinoalloteichus spitiensis TaxID=252394 RepID=UPI000475319B|nr:PhzF family phenazine biosynthesis protein [Actinoalloteichus spitiensis]
MSVDVYLVDAFSDRAFGGNPAGVVLLPGFRDPEWMQAVAAELKHSETAFVQIGSEDPDAALPLRWFTPETEVDLCGHATLAAAHVLGGSQRFATRSGELRCVSTGGGWVEMDFPADPPSRVDGVPPTGLPEVTVTGVGMGREDLLVELGSPAEVRGLRPDIAALAALPGRGVIFTAEETGGEADFVSRCFYPKQGVPEDPVTGSAHCALAGWWSERLGRSSLLGEQASARGGRVRLEVEGERVRLGGRAVTVLRGSLYA